MPKLDHPYRQLTNGQWLRGNLHTHTNNSDGAERPQRVINDYAKLGYDFLAISDHDILTNSRDYKKWNNRGMVLLPGNEITANGSHILHVGADRLVPPLPQRQEVFNRVTAGSGLAVVAHPNWQESFDYTSIDKLREWVGYHGLEVFNTVIGRLQGSPYCTNKWDILLSEGRRLFGYANDDSHIRSDIGNGWNMVYSRERTAKGILAAIAAGRFYPSTGVIISSIRVQGSRIRIETENARRIVAIGHLGTRLQVTDDNHIDFEAKPDSSYVRFECWGDGEQFAWTQPFFNNA